VHNIIFHLVDHLVWRVSEEQPENQYISASADQVKPFLQQDSQSLKTTYPYAVRMKAVQRSTGHQLTNCASNQTQLHLTLSNATDVYDFLISAGWRNAPTKFTKITENGTTLSHLALATDSRCIGKSVHMSITCDCDEHHNSWTYWQVLFWSPSIILVFSQHCLAQTSSWGWTKRQRVFQINDKCLARCRKTTHGKHTVVNKHW